MFVCSPSHPLRYQDGLSDCPKDLTKFWASVGDSHLDNGGKICVSWGPSLKEYDGCVFGRFMVEI